MIPTEELLRLYDLKPLIGHARIEIDGTPCNLENFWERHYDGAIVRIHKHLYVDGRPMTEDAPEWEDLWNEQT